MSDGLYNGSPGLSLGTGLYRDVSGLWGGASGLSAGFGNPSPDDPGPYLILDFIGSSYFDLSEVLTLDFATESYEAYNTDPNAPRYVNLWAWS